MSVQNKITSPLSVVAYTGNAWESPLATLRIVRPLQQTGITLIKGNEGQHIFPERVSQADLVVVQREFPANTEMYAQIVALAREEGKPVVLDLDDLLLALPAGHPDRTAHYYTNALFPVTQAIVDADGLTVSSEPLRRVIQELNPNVWLLPNYLDNRIWSFRHAVEHSQFPVVIGYMGGDSHAPDIEAVATPLTRIVEKYGERVLLRWYGLRPVLALRNFPSVEWIPLAEYDYARFAGFFGSQECDIYIAPLQENLFNRCKSSVKYLEYSVSATPGVYSQIDPYSAVVRHGENGFLAADATEWEEYLSRLVEDPHLRFEIGRKAQETVRLNWLLSEHAGEWLEVYRSILARPSKKRPTHSQALSVFLQVAEQQRELERDQSLRLVEMEKVIQNLSEHLASVNQSYLHLESERNLLYSQLNGVYQGAAWKIAQAQFKLLRVFVPRGGLLERWLKSALNGLRKLWKNIFSGTSQKQGEIIAKPQASGMPESQTRNDLQAGAPSLPVDLDHHLSELYAKGKLSSTGFYDVFVMPIIPWSFRFQRPQQLANLFARAGHRVFYAQTGFRDIDRAYLRWLQENVFEVLLPGPAGTVIYTDVIDKTFEERLSRAYQALASMFKIENAICLVDLPFWTPLALRLREEYGWKVVYDCMDHHEGFSTNSPEMLKQETNLSQESDLILASSEILFDEKFKQNPNCQLVPNGGDFLHFHYALKKVPEELEEISGPVIGYYGAIADWFDTDLVRDLAESRRDWSFVLIGRTDYSDLAKLEGQHNIHVLGEKPYYSLPQYLAAFNVAIIPFKKTPLTEATNPVKLFEYLSAGKAIVATDLGELRRYSDYVRLATSKEEWCRAIDQSLRDYSWGAIQARLKFARQNTWEERFSLVEKSIQNLYHKASN